MNKYSLLAGMRTAAQMISEASVRFNINPKVILSTLQKEQSLITRKAPLAADLAHQPAKVPPMFNSG